MRRSDAAGVLTLRKRENFDPVTPIGHKFYTVFCHSYTGEAIMSRVITKEESVLLNEASEMFHETGCVPGIDGEQVPAERIVPDAKEYILETIDDPEIMYDPEIWDFPLSWFRSVTRSEPGSLRASRARRKRHGRQQPIP